MAQIVELVRRGFFLEGLDEEVGRDADALCHLMADRITDAVFSLGLFEEAWAAREQRSDTWERDREAERAREQELAAANPPPPHDSWDARKRWEDDLRDQAKRDVVRAKWAAGALPEAYQGRLPSVHARAFVLALAQISRALSAMAKLDTGDAQREIVAARDGFRQALPNVVPVRDSIEHAEDRMRSLNKKGQPLALAPIDNQLINAPGGGVLVSDSLNGRLYGPRSRMGLTPRSRSPTPRWRSPAPRSSASTTPCRGWKPGARSTGRRSASTSALFAQRHQPRLGRDGHSAEPKIRMGMRPRLRRLLWIM